MLCYRKDAQQEVTEMSKIYNRVTEFIGNTPLMEICRIEKEKKLKARVLVKLEYLNPAGSTKDRAAKYMIEDARERGAAEGGIRDY